jgi:hypothetical protein
VAAVSEVSELEQRRRDVRYEWWAASLHRAQLQKQLHEAEMVAAGKAIPAARARLDRATADLKRAQEERQATDYAYSGAERRQGEARAQAQRGRGRDRLVGEGVSDECLAVSCRSRTP